MKIKSYEIFRCDAGWRTFSFLKLVTDGGGIVEADLDPVGRRFAVERQPGGAGSR